MNDLNMGLENLINANGITISIVGIFIVFSALTIIALFISLLPKLLPLLEKLFPVEDHSHAAPSSEAAGHDEILAAVAYTLFHKQAGSLPAK